LTDDDRGLIARVLEEVPREPDGGIDEKLVLARLAELLSFDENMEREKKAKRLLNEKTRPGGTAAEGQLSLPGLDPYAYEPDRLIRYGENMIVENRRARPQAKQAEAERAAKNVDRAMVWQRRKQQEVNRFMIWALEEYQAGRSDAEIIFDACMRETGLWNQSPAPPEDGPPDES
jgi:hypothetical protein